MSKYAIMLLCNLDKLVIFSRSHLHHCFSSPAFLMCTLILKPHNSSVNGYLAKGLSTLLCMAYM